MPTDQSVPDLRDLAGIDTPEVVRPAFRRFRRRLILGITLLLAATVWLTIVYPLFLRDLPDAFEAERSLAGPDIVEYEHVDVILLDAQPLGRYTCNFMDCYGVHLLVIPKDLPDTETLGLVNPAPEGAAYRFRGSGPGSNQPIEAWFMPSSGSPRITVELFAEPLTTAGPSLSPGPDARPLETVTLDLEALGYPPEIWIP